MKKKEKTNMKMSMREFFEPFREELLQQGKVQGAIIALLDLDVSNDVIIDRISKRFAISKEQVKAELDKLLVHA